MPRESGKISDEVQAVGGEIVGNEQWAEEAGNSGPDPAQWSDPDAREDTGFEPGQSSVVEVDGQPTVVAGPVKGPDPSQHPDREVAPPSQA